MNPFEPMNDAQLEELLERLTCHAIYKLLRLRWRGLTLKQGGSIPGGVEARDLATDAVIDVINGTRTWDPAIPLLLFLKGVVDSKVSNLVTSAENRTTRRFPAATDDSELPEPCVDGQAPDPAAAVADADSMQVFRDEVVAAVRNDPLVLRIFECLENDITKPSEMAVVLDQELREINNAQKRLRNKVSKVLKKLKGGGEHGRHRTVR